MRLHFHALVIDRRVYVETATKSIRVHLIPQIKHWCMEASLSLLWERFLAGKKILERFSNRRKTSAKVITPTNHNRRKQRDEPIRMCRNVTCLSAGKIVPTRCNLVWFCFSLVEKLARRFSQSLSAAIAIVLFLSTVI